ncbi:MAG: hypothetical protein EZS28_042963 [Streblomastix strix]|uniref:RRM domain-containing protein n=1 Tax=Streblomastix strix TaxID=222440 RepID=A0A5J4TU20_9EUKA|nr:MAG: hypothetical protein EZS28_042963 [Streblomastix strix]
MAQINLNVSWTTGRLTYFQVRKVFLPLGAIEVNMLNAPAGQDGGRATVKFKSLQDADKALQSTNGKDFEGITINVDLQQQQTVQSPQKAPVSTPKKKEEQQQQKKQKDEQERKRIESEQRRLKEQEQEQENLRIKKEQDNLKIEAEKERKRIESEQQQRLNQLNEKIATETPKSQLGHRLAGMLSVSDILLKQ